MLIPQKFYAIIFIAITLLSGCTMDKCYEADDFGNYVTSSEQKVYPFNKDNFYVWSSSLLGKEMSLPKADITEAQARYGAGAWYSFTKDDDSTKDIYVYQGKKIKVKAKSSVQLAGFSTEKKIELTPTSTTHNGQSIYVLPMVAMDKVVYPNETIKMTITTTQTSKTAANPSVNDVQLTSGLGVYVMLLPLENKVSSLGQFADSANWSCQNGLGGHLMWPYKDDALLYDDGIACSFDLDFNGCNKDTTNGLYAGYKKMCSGMYYNTTETFEDLDSFKSATVETRNRNLFFALKDKPTENRLRSMGTRWNLARDCAASDFSNISNTTFNDGNSYNKCHHNVFGRAATGMPHRGSTSPPRVSWDCVYKFVNPLTFLTDFSVCTPDSTTIGWAASSAYDTGRWNYQGSFSRFFFEPSGTCDSVRTKYNIDNVFKYFGGPLSFAYMPYDGFWGGFDEWQHESSSGTPIERKYYMRAAAKTITSCSTDSCKIMEIKPDSSFTTHDSIKVYAQAEYTIDGKAKQYMQCYHKLAGKWDNVEITQGFFQCLYAANNLKNSSTNGPGDFYATQSNGNTFKFSDALITNSVAVNTVYIRGIDKFVPTCFDSFASTCTEKTVTSCSPINSSNRNSFSFNAKWPLQQLKIAFMLPDQDGTDGTCKYNITANGVSQDFSFDLSSCNTSINKQACEDRRIKVFKRTIDGVVNTWNNYNNLVLSGQNISVRIGDSSGGYTQYQQILWEQADGSVATIFSKYDGAQTFAGGAWRNNRAGNDNLEGSELGNTKSCAANTMLTILPIGNVSCLSGYIKRCSNPRITVSDKCVKQDTTDGPTLGTCNKITNSVAKIQQYSNTNNKIANSLIDVGSSYADAERVQFGHCGACIKKTTPIDSLRGLPKPAIGDFATSLDGITDNTACEDSTNFKWVKQYVTNDSALNVVKYTFEPHSLIGTCPDSSTTAQTADGGLITSLVPLSARQKFNGAYYGGVGNSPSTPNITFRIPQEAGTENGVLPVIGVAGNGNSLSQMFTSGDITRNKETVSSKEKIASFTVTLSTGEASKKGKHMYFYVQEFTKTKGLYTTTLDDTKHPNVFFSGKTHKEIAAMALREDIPLYNYYNMDAATAPVDGLAIFTSGHSGKLWATILDPEPEDINDLETDGKTLYFTPSAEVAPKTAADTSNLISWNSGAFKVTVSAEKKAGIAAGSISQAINNYLIEAVKSVLFGTKKGALCKTYIVPQTAARVVYQTSSPDVVAPIDYTTPNCSTNNIATTVQTVPITTIPTLKSDSLQYYICSTKNNIGKCNAGTSTVNFSTKNLANTPNICSSNVNNIYEISQDAFTSDGYDNASIIEPSVPVFGSFLAPTAEVNIYNTNANAVSYRTNKYDCFKFYASGNPLDSNTTLYNTAANSISPRCNDLPTFQMQNSNISVSAYGLHKCNLIDWSLSLTKWKPVKPESTSCSNGLTILDYDVNNDNIGKFWRTDIRLKTLQEVTGNISKFTTCKLYQSGIAISGDIPLKMDKYGDCTEVCSNGAASCTNSEKKKRCSIYRYNSAGGSTPQSCSSKSFTDTSCWAKLDRTAEFDQPFLHISDNDYLPDSVMPSCSSDYTNVYKKYQNCLTYGGKRFCDISRSCYPGPATTLEKYIEVPISQGDGVDPSSAVTNIQGLTGCTNVVANISYSSCELRTNNSGIQQKFCFKRENGATSSVKVEVPIMTQEGEDPRNGNVIAKTCTTQTPCSYYQLKYTPPNWQAAAATPVTPVCSVSNAVIQETKFMPITTIPTNLQYDSQQYYTCSRTSTSTIQPTTRTIGKCGVSVSVDFSNTNASNSSCQTAYERKRICFNGKNPAGLSDRGSPFDYYWVYYQNVACSDTSNVTMGSRIERSVVDGSSDLMTIFEPKTINFKYTDIFGSGNASTAASNFKNKDFNCLIFASGNAGTMGGYGFEVASSDSILQSSDYISGLGTSVTSDSTVSAAPTCFNNFPTSNAIKVKGRKIHIKFWTIEECFNYNFNISGTKWTPVQPYFNSCPGTVTVLNYDTSTDPILQLWKSDSYYNTQSALASAINTYTPSAVVNYNSHTCKLMQGNQELATNIPLKMDKYGECAVACKSGANTCANADKKKTCSIYRFTEGSSMSAEACKSLAYTRTDCWIKLDQTAEFNYPFDHIADNDYLPGGVIPACDTTLTNVYKKYQNCTTYGSTYKCDIIRSCYPGPEPTTKTLVEVPSNIINSVDTSSAVSNIKEITNCSDTFANISYSNCSTKTNASGLQQRFCTMTNGNVVSSGPMEVPLTMQNGPDPRNGSAIGKTCQVTRQCQAADKPSNNIPPSILANQVTIMTPTVPTSPQSSSSSSGAAAQYNQANLQNVTTTEVCNDGEDREWTNGILYNIFTGITSSVTLQTIFTIGMIFIITMKGYNIALGKASISLSDLSKDFMNFAIIFSVFWSGTWEFYQKYVIENILSFTQGMNSLVVAELGYSDVDDDNPFGPIDAVFDKIFLNDVNWYKTSAILFGSWQGWIYCLILIFAFFSYLINILKSIILYISCLTMMSIYLGMGPIFFAFRLSERTASYFENWWQGLMGFMASQFYMFSIIAFFTILYLNIVESIMYFKICFRSIWKIPVVNITILGWWRMACLPPDYMTQYLDMTSTQSNSFGSFPSISKIIVLLLIIALMEKFLNAPLFGGKDGLEDIMGINDKLSNARSQMRDMTIKGIKAPINMAGKLAAAPLSKIGGQGGESIASGLGDISRAFGNSSAPRSASRNSAAGNANKAQNAQKPANKDGKPAAANSNKSQKGDSIAASRTQPQNSTANSNAQPINNSNPTENNPSTEINSENTRNNPTTQSDATSPEDFMDNSFMQDLDENEKPMEQNETRSGVGDDSDTTGPEDFMDNSFMQDLDENEKPMEQNETRSGVGDDIASGTEQSENTSANPITQNVTEGGNINTSSNGNPEGESGSTNMAPDAATQNKDAAGQANEAYESRSDINGNTSPHNESQPDYEDFMSGSFMQTAETSAERQNRYQEDSDGFFADSFLNTPEEISAPVEQQTSEPLQTLSQIENSTPQTNTEINSTEPSPSKTITKSSSSGRKASARPINTTSSATTKSKPKGPQWNSDTKMSDWYKKQDQAVYGAYTPPPKKSTPSPYAAKPKKPKK